MTIQTFQVVKQPISGPRSPRAVLLNSRHSSVFQNAFRSSAGICCPRPERGRMLAGTGISIVFASREDWAQQAGLPVIYKSTGAQFTIPADYYQVRKLARLLCWTCILFTYECKGREMPRLNHIVANGGLHLCFTLDAGTPEQ